MHSRYTSILIVIIGAFISGPPNAWAQHSINLPLVAQEALDKGIQATKLPDYPLAIRFFEEAQRSAPENPTILFNLGLAESRVPGRELRAIAWLEAFLLANPDSPNAAAVKDKISELDLRSQSNLAGYLKTLQAAATQMTGERQSYDLFWVAKYWAESGDISTADATAGLIQDGYYSSLAQAAVASALARRGESEAAGKGFAAALLKADSITNANRKTTARSAIGDVQKTVATSRVSPSTLSIIDWTVALGSDPLNSAPILDLASHLKSLPTVNEPQKVFEPMRQTADKLVRSQAIVETLMKGGRNDYPGVVLETVIAKDAARIAALPIEGLTQALGGVGPLADKREFEVKLGSFKLAPTRLMVISASGFTAAERDTPDKPLMDVPCTDISEAKVPGGGWDARYFRIRVKGDNKSFLAKNGAEAYFIVQTIISVCGLNPDNKSGQ